MNLLHKYIQYLFGWEDSHLHSFVRHFHCEVWKSRPGEVKQWGKKDAWQRRQKKMVKNMLRDRRRRDEESDVSSDSDEEHNYGDKPIPVKGSETVGEIFLSGRSDIAMRYTYDFGDTNHVDITSEGRIVRDQAYHLPILLRGRGAVNTIDAFNTSSTDHLRRSLWWNTRERIWRMNSTLQLHIPG